MFGLNINEVYSVVDKKINVLVKKINNKFESYDKRQSNMKGKISLLENRLAKMEQFLKIEMVDGEQPKYEKITKTKK